MKENLAKTTAPWQSIIDKPCALAPDCHWSVDWRVRVHYEKPDGVVADGQGDFWFVDRHVRPGANLDGKLVARDSPGLDESPLGCAVSAASLPRTSQSPHGGELRDTCGNRSAHQSDWDFLDEARDRFLDRAGVRSTAGLREKADALASMFAGGGYRHGKQADFTHGFHPVDTLLHGQHCTGQSSALAAMCHTMGVPARTLNFAGHSVCETFVEGRWLLYDNQTEQVAAGRSYMEEVADPASSKLTAGRAQWYHWLLNTGGERNLIITKGKWPNAVETAPFNHGAQVLWRFNATGIGATHRMLCIDGGHGFTLPLCPDTANALYPNEPRHVFKYNACEPCRMTLNLPHTWFLAPLVLRGRAAVRKAFWIGALDGATRVDSFLGAFPGRMWHLHAPYDPRWFVRVNEITRPLCDAQWKAGFVHYGFEIELPLKHLREHALNEIELGCDQDHGEFIVVGIYPDLLEPHTPPFRGKGENQIPRSEVTNVHAADRYAFHCPA